MTTQEFTNYINSQIENAIHLYHTLINDIEESTSRSEYIEKYNILKRIITDENHPLYINNIKILNADDKQFISNMIEREALQRFSHPIGIKYYETLKTEEARKDEVVRWYKRKTGRTLNWDNLQTFNEKMQLLKLRPDDLKVSLADKVRAQQVICNQLKLNPDFDSLNIVSLFTTKYRIWNSYNDITLQDIASLPEQFVLKTNNGVGSHIIVKSKKNAPSLDEIKEHFKKLLNTSFSSIAPYEVLYDKIEPLIYAEEYLEDNDDEIKDYKFMCFNGKVEFIWVDKDRYTNHKRNLYDTQWNELPFGLACDKFDDIVEKPTHLDMMIKISEEIAKYHNHIRVDFFITKENRLILGEVTSTSDSGIWKWFPESMNLHFGKMIDISTL